MKKVATLFVFGGVLLFQARGDDSHVVSGLFKQADAARAAAKFDDALHLYEQVIIEHPEASNRWFDAQMGITQALIKKGDFVEAAKSAHLCLDGAPEGTYESVVVLTAGILSAQDKNVDRANKLITFEQSGGRNGQINPLDSVGYPALPQRESAFATVRRQAGDDATASRLRALTYIFTGHPKDALAQYADAFRRAEIGSMPQVVSDLIGIGLRDARGHRAGLDEAIQFVVWGPKGPDGNAGNADDVSDPFAQWLPSTPALGEDGLAGFNPEELATLRQVRDAAQLYGGDPFVPEEVRHNALSALQRVSQALEDWDGPGRKEWYLSRALPDSAPAPDGQSRQLLLRGAELAARGDSLHLGGIHDLWREIDPKLAAEGLQGDKSVQEVRTQFDRMCSQISQYKFPKSDLKPLTVPATF